MSPLLGWLRWILTPRHRTISVLGRSRSGARRVLVQCRASGETAGCSFGDVGHGVADDEQRAQEIAIATLDVRCDRRHRGGAICRTEDVYATEAQP